MKAYQTVYELIRNEIEAGKYSIGDLLPPEPELQKTYQYSRTTIRKAISLLVNDGFISVQQGKGTQVISGIPRNEYYKFHNSPDITEIFASNDSSIVMEKLSIDSVEANQEISNALSLPISSRVYRVQRLLSNAGIPFSYIINYIRQDVAPELPKFSNISFLNLYQLLEQEYGILFKNAEALEISQKINTVMFDKTGTLTEGKPYVTDIISDDKDKLLLIAASAENGSEHPLGEAIVREAKEKNIKLLNIENFKAIAGFGIEVFIDNKKVLMGNDKLMNKENINTENYNSYMDKLSKEGKTPMYVAYDNKLLGIIAVADKLKKESIEAINRLHKLGIKTAMITGDNKNTANSVAKEAGIDIVFAEVLPEEKSNEVKKLQDQGLTVAMVGDGINDAPALTQANVGIAIGSGTDVAIESADIVLVKSNTNDVVTAIELSKVTMRDIKQNLFWAFCYNVIGIPIAAGVLHVFREPLIASSIGGFLTAIMGKDLLLNPIFAALAMSLSSVSVVTNALRLNFFKPSK